MLLSSVAKGFRRVATELIEQYRRMSNNAAQRRFGFDPASIPARQRYMNRIRRLVENVIKWRRYAKERDGLGLMVSELVEVVLLGVAEGGWDVGGREVLERVSGFFVPGCS